MSQEKPCEMEKKMTISWYKRQLFWKKIYRSIAWLGLLGLLSGFSNGLSDQQILRNFDRIAFGNEYTGEKFSRVRKWAEPIRLGIQGKYHPNHFETNVRQYAQDLQKITGYPVSLYYSYKMQKEGRLARDFNKKKVNVILYYLPKRDIAKNIAQYYDNSSAAVDKMVRSSTCFAKYFRRRNEIRVAIVVFPDHLPRDIIRACVVEELAQIMGLANDSDQVNPSIFNDSSLHRELTDHDKTLLKILYDPRITFNMRRRDALEKAGEILKELRRAVSDK